MSFKKGMRKFFGAFLLPMDDVEVKPMSRRLYDLLDENMGDSRLEVVGTSEDHIILATREANKVIHVTVSTMPNSYIMLSRNEAWRYRTDQGDGQESRDKLTDETLADMFPQLSLAFITLSPSERARIGSIQRVPVQIVDDEAQRFVEKEDEQYVE